MLTEKDLLEKKEEIEATKQEISELNGQEKTLLNQLKEEFDCDDLPAAKTKLKGMEANNAALTKEIEEKTAALEEMYLTEED